MACSTVEAASCETESVWQMTRPRRLSVSVCPSVPCLCLSCALCLSRSPATSASCGLGTARRLGTNTCANPSDTVRRRLGTRGHSPWSQPAVTAQAHALAVDASAEDPRPRAHLRRIGHRTALDYPIANGVRSTPILPIALLHHVSGAHLRLVRRHVLVVQVNAALQRLARTGCPSVLRLGLATLVVELLNSCAMQRDATTHVTSDVPSDASCTSHQTARHADVAETRLHLRAPVPPLTPDPVASCGTSPPS